MTANPDTDGAPPVPEIPDLTSLTGSMLSQVTGSTLSQMSSSDKPADEVDSLGPLLPSTVYKGPSMPARSASAPPEKSMGGLPSHPAYKPGLPSTRRLSKGHIRKISPPDLASAIPNVNAITSIDEALTGTDDQHIIIIPEPEADIIMLPELQHLAGPPPPLHRQQCSPSHHSGLINIAIDGTESNLSSDLSSGLSQAPSQFPQAMERAMTTSPQAHRRGAGSVSGESFTSRMRGVADRMRSSSRTGRVKSPALGPHAPMPYETNLPYSEGMARAKSPYEMAMSNQNDQMFIPPPPPAPAQPPAGYEHMLNETSIPPRAHSAANAYRSPKEIRANMPPDYTQAGAQGGFL